MRTHRLLGTRRAWYFVVLMRSTSRLMSQGKVKQQTEIRRLLVLQLHLKITKITGKAETVRINLMISVENNNDSIHLFAGQDHAYDYPNC